MCIVICVKCTQTADYCWVFIFSICHFPLWFTPLLQPSPPSAGIIKKGRTLSIISSINEDDWTSEQEHIGLTPPTCSAPDPQPPRVCSHPICHHSFSWNRGMRLNGPPWKYDFQYALLTHRGEAFAKFYQSVQLCIKWLSKDQPSFFML